MIVLLALVACRNDSPEGDRVELPVREVAVSGPRLLRRLTHAEYDRTVSDLLGLESTWGASFPPDDVVTGLDDDAAALGVGGLLADQYRIAAEALADEAMTLNREQIVPCDPAAGAADCAIEVVVSFGERAFRRPLTQEEADRWFTVWDAGRQGEGFDAGVRWLVAGMLQSPSFLYRSELGAAVDGAYRLTDWELASELSYLLCDTMPDDALFEAARAGELQNPVARRTHAERLVAEGCAAERVAELVESWLDLDLLPNVTRDGATYPELTDALRADMAEETRRFVVDVVLDGGSLSDLLLADHGFLTAELAAHYGVPFEGAVDAEGFARVSLAGTPYGGLLTHGSLLTTHALPTSSSPVHRGIVVRERLLCQELPPPPADLDISPPQDDPTLSTRDRYTQHATDPACSGCHVLIDPIGFGFEHFDGIGRYRDTDGLHPVDASGEVVGSGSSNGSFYGVHELSALLATGGDLQRCWTEVQVRSAFGLADVAVLGDPTSDLAARWADGALPPQELLLALTELPHFSQRVGGKEGDAIGVDEPEAVLEPPYAVDTGLAEDVTAPTGPELVVTIDRDWGSGYCADAVVTNHGDEDVVWRVHHEPYATITSTWDAVYEADGDTAVWFSGEAWNATLAPGELALFGFCADR